MNAGWGHWFSCCHLCTCGLDSLSDPLPSEPNSPIRSIHPYVCSALQSRQPINNVVCGRGRGGTLPKKPSFSFFLPPSEIHLYLSTHFPACLWMTMMWSCKHIIHRCLLHLLFPCNCKHATRPSKACIHKLCDFHPLCCCVIGKIGVTIIFKRNFWRSLYCTLLKKVEHNIAI